MNFEQSKEHNTVIIQTGFKTKYFVAKASQAESGQKLQILLLFSLTRLTGMFI